MVRYSLTCAQGHAFEAWFASAAAFDDLSGRGLATCAECGSAKVGKALMAPTVRTNRPVSPRLAPAIPSSSALAPGPLSTPRDPREEALARLRAHVEATSENVGLAFAAEARAIHEGDAPERSIHGQARPDEARALIEDGIPVAALPFMPRRGTH